MSTGQPPTRTRSQRLQVKLGRRRVGGILLVLLAAAAVAMIFIGLSDSPETVADDRTGLPLAPVELRTLSSQVQVDGTLEYAGDYSIINRAQAINEPSPSDVLAAQQEAASARSQLEAAKAARAELDTASAAAVAAAEEAVRKAQEALDQAQRDAESVGSSLASAKAKLLAEEAAYCALWPWPVPGFCPNAEAVPISFEDEQALLKIIANGTPESSLANADAVLAANESYRSALAAKDAADAAVESAQSDLNAANDDLSKAQAGPSSEEVAGADASVEAAQAGLEAAEAKLAEASQGSPDGSGTLSGLPAVGQVVEAGDALYWVDSLPVILLYGDLPAHRDLAAGKDGSALKGPDVRQLNANLVAMGYATPEELDPESDEFTPETERALKKLQAELGVEQTGVLKLGYVVFLPTAARVTERGAALGAPLEIGAAVLSATSTTPVVSVALDPGRQSQVSEGDEVTITLPSLETTTGTVASVSKVATAPAGDGAGGENDVTIDVEIALDDPAAAGGLDEAPVIVSITTAVVEDALVVPVTSLLALAGGGYAVEVVDANGGRTLVPVELGMFDSGAGVVQLTNTTLEAGQQVVVPGQ